MATNSSQESKVHTKGSDIGTSFTGYPENSKITFFIVLKESRLMDCPYTKLAFHSRDQRRSLKECASKSL